MDSMPARSWNKILVTVLFLLSKIDGQIALASVLYYNAGARLNQENGIPKFVGKINYYLVQPYEFVLSSKNVVDTMVFLTYNVKAVYVGGKGP